ncbi:DUF5134 domain-containing protein [Arthrobacter sp. Leaf69]|uniref:DUF5134 domain-containing protein n=1 Tax=Arthrobacter sp. Leaf69 TaxID=1736232 RepID=UPI0006F9ADF6|nr:DUF5134 domain-containing protein [Arthrobacter sp. Leaf69]KQN91234.1 hypothetical protein ASE96_18150 [Arthrobacter sp. Leaf69]
MFGSEFLRWGLTALLLAASLYAVFRAGRPSPPATRVGFGLHAGMMFAMVLMVVPGLQWPALPQILLFGLAAWWFVLRAVAWRPAPAGMHAPAASPGRGRAERAGRGSLLYDALTMAAMAYMLVAMDLHGAYGTLAVSDAAGIPDQAPHHAGPAVALSLPGALPVAEQGWVSQSAVVLALAFGLAGAVWCLLLFRRLSTPGRPRSGEALLELAGSASIAVMFAALAA